VTKAVAWEHAWSAPSICCAACNVNWGAADATQPCRRRYPAFMDGRRSAESYVHIASTFASLMQLAAPAAVRSLTQRARSPSNLWCLTLQACVCNQRRYPVTCALFFLRDSCMHQFRGSAPPATLRPAQIPSRGRLNAAILLVYTDLQASPTAAQLTESLSQRGQPGERDLAASRRQLRPKHHERARVRRQRGELQPANDCLAAVVQA
jgi:hypothetical protein